MLIRSVSKVLLAISLSATNKRTVLYKTERAAEQAAARAGLVPRSSTHPVPDLTEAAVRWAQLGRSLPLPRFW